MYIIMVLAHYQKKTDDAISLNSITAESNEWYLEVLTKSSKHREWNKWKKWSEWQIWMEQGIVMEIFAFVCALLI